MQVENRRDIVSIHSITSTRPITLSTRSLPLPTVAIVSSSSIRSNALSTISSMRSFQKPERFERPGLTFWTALREVRLSLCLGRVKEGLVSCLPRSLVLSLVTLANVVRGDWLPNCRSVLAERAMSFLAHLLSCFRRTLPPCDGLCISRVTGVVAVCGFWLRTPQCRSLWSEH